MFKVDNKTKKFVLEVGRILFAFSLCFAAIFFIFGVGYIAGYFFGGEIGVLAGFLALAFLNVLEIAHTDVYATPKETELRMNSMFP